MLVCRFPVSGQQSGALVILAFIVAVLGWIAFDNAKNEDQDITVYLPEIDDITTVPDNTIYTITIPEPETCIEIVVCGRLTK
jgi:hypothetical protein